MKVNIGDFLRKDPHNLRGFVLSYPNPYKKNPIPILYLIWGRNFWGWRT